MTHGLEYMGPWIRTVHSVGTTARILETEPVAISVVLQNDEMLFLERNWSSVLNLINLSKMGRHVLGTNRGLKFLSRCGVLLSLACDLKEPNAIDHSIYP
jgi:hypothetical protein